MFSVDKGPIIQWLASKNNIKMDNKHLKMLRGNILPCRLIQMKTQVIPHALGGSNKKQMTSVGTGLERCAATMENSVIVSQSETQLPHDPAVVL